MQTRRTLLRAASGAFLWGTTAGFAPAASGTTLRAASPAELARQLAACSGGEIIELTGGPWRDIRIGGVHFSKPVRISPAPGTQVEINRLKVQNSSGLLFRDLRFQYVFKDGTSWRDRPFDVDHSRSVTFANCRFRGAPGKGSVKNIDISGAPWGNGPSLRHSNDCHMLSCTSNGFRQGMVLVTSKGCSIRGCRIEGQGNDNIRLIEVSDIRVEDNYLGQQNSHPREPYHNDHIHHYNPHATEPSRRVTIRRNMLYSDRGVQKSSAGMMLQVNGSHNLRDWAVEDNVVIGRAHHGISLWNVHGATVRRNTLIRWHPQAKSAQSAHDYRLDTPKINIRKGSRSVVVEDNLMVLPLISKGAEVHERGNVVIPPESYSAVFTMPDPRDPRTWRVHAGGRATNKGSPLLW